MYYPGLAPRQSKSASLQKLDRDHAEKQIVRRVTLFRTYSGHIDPPISI